MNLPIAGSWSVRVDAVRPFLIHGDRYFELQITRLDGPAASASVVRIPEHVIAGAPRAGERYSITFLMGQITSMEWEKSEHPGDRPHQ